MQNMTVFVIRAKHAEFIQSICVTQKTDAGFIQCIRCYSHVSDSLRVVFMSKHAETFTKQTDLFYLAGCYDVLSWIISQEIIRRV